MDRYNKSREYDRLFESDKWREKIPFIPTFPEGYEIKIIPPTRGAIVRFLVRKGELFVSVYLDCYEELGHYGSPYWEMYPYEDDVRRFSIVDTNELRRSIIEELERA